MNRYIVKVIENRIYEFVIKADSKEEAEKSIMKKIMILWMKQVNSLIF